MTFCLKVVYLITSVSELAIYFFKNQIQNDIEQNVPYTYP